MQDKKYDLLSKQGVAIKSGREDVIVRLRSVRKGGREWSLNGLTAKGLQIPLQLIINSEFRIL